MKFDTPTDGYGVDFGRVDGETRVYLVRFVKGRRISCHKLAPGEAELLARQLSSAAQRAINLDAKVEGSKEKTT